MSHMTPTNDIRPKSLWRTRYGVGLLILGAVAAFFLLAEHRAHLFGALPFLLILACPLMHLFMHRGHGTHGHHSGAEQPQISNENPNQENPGERS